MRIDYSGDRNADFCKHCGHNAVLHALSWDRDQTSTIHVSYCKALDCNCDRFSLDELSYAQRFPQTVRS